jgi:hypothetical protein
MRLMPKLAEHSLGDKPFLVVESDMVTNSSNTKEAEGVELGRTGREGRQIGVRP